MKPWPLANLNVNHSISSEGQIDCMHLATLLYLAKNSVLAIQFHCGSKSEKELTLIIIRTSIGHCNQSSSYKTKPLVKFIL